MPKVHRLVGITRGAVDTKAHEIQFDLQDSERRTVSFVGRFGPIAQVIAGLARLHFELRQILQTAKAMEPTAAEEIGGHRIHADSWSPVVLVELVTPQGVPYTFEVSRQMANEIADRLKSESAKIVRTQTGQA